MSVEPARFELPNPHHGPVVGAIVATIAFAAAAYGGVQDWVQPLLLVVAVLLALATVFYRSNRFPRAIWLILGGFLTLIVLQLVPLPLSITGVLSPVRAERLSELTPSPPDTATLSYYALETRRGLAHLLLGIAVFAAVGGTIRSTSGLKWLLSGLFAVGVAEAILAIALIATEASGIYWDPAVGGGTTWTGSFLNHSNFSQLVNLAIGAGIGLVLIRSSEQRHRAPYRRTGVIDFAQQHGRILAGIAVMVVAVAASLSRGGVLGALVASTLVAVALGREKNLGPRSWAFLLVPLAAFIGLVLVGFDSVYERLGTLEEHETYTDRWDLTLDTLRAGWEHLLLGTGLGTHRFAFPIYDTTGSIALAEQADNDYAQLFEETGLLGVGLVAAFLGSLVWIGAATLSQSRSPARYALYGVLYGLAACAVQSLTDFGQRLPAVFCTSAAMCGIVVATAAIDRQQNGAIEQAPMWKRWQAWAATLVILSGGSWLTYESWRDYQGGQWWAFAYRLEERLRDDEWIATPEDYVDLLTASENAATTRPDDVEYAFWLNTYRWQAFTAGIDPAELVVEREGREVAEQIADELAASRLLCPTYGPSHTLEGQIRLALGEPIGFELIANGVRLAPHDPQACFVAANAASLQEPVDRQRVAELVERCLALDNSYYQPAAALWLETFDEIEAPRRLAGNDADRLRQLADLLANRPGKEEVSAELRAEADEITAQRIQSGEASAGQMAAMASDLAKAGNAEEAIKLYRQALAQQYTNVRWRIALCDLLQSIGQYDEAYREARLCFRLRPGWEPAKQRMKELSLVIDQPR